MYTVPLDVVKFCAEECKRQNSGEVSVYHMCDAWYDMLPFATHTNGPLSISVSDIEEWGRLIEPEKNANGFRTTPVRFADYGLAIDADLVSHAVETLLWGWHSLTAGEIYQEFQEIHPFVDGNGRLGALLFNLRNATFHYPVMPPPFQK